MNCDTCGRAHRADARFCGGCGRAFAPRCPACGVEGEPDARFCERCGAALVAHRADDAEARKVVTIVFADLVGSTALHERLDAESVRRFMDRYYRAMRGAVEAEGGTVTQLLGDGVMAVFGAPRVAENDALRAVRAAVGMQRAFRALADAQSGLVWQTGLRVAVNTGEIVASDQSEIIGDPVNVAARLQEQARDGDVVIGESTRRLVGELVTLAPLGTFALKGRGETVAAYRVVSLERPAGAPATAFVGREDELGRLTAVYEAAVTAPRARLAVVLGSPGLGKSRLLAELSRRLGDGATVLSAHCDAAGGATFAPIAEALRTVLRLDVDATGDAVRAALDAVAAGDDAERGRIAAGIAALLAGTPAPPEETFFVVRRFLAALATAQPVVLTLDDVQWAEPLLLDLTEHLAQWSTAVPLLILVAARPELHERRSSLAVPGGLVAEVVTLAGLDAGAATRLAANVIGADELPAAIAGRVLATSEGNPLFVGELVRMLVHDGALVREGDRWTAAVELAALEIPPTIHALLAARIERLAPEERTVLERAAVIGRQFSRTALAHLLPRALTNLDARLESLRRSELIESDVGWLLGEPVLRFHHVLIRDAAYRRLLKGTRAELHGRFADWLEAHTGAAIEHDETIGWHLEQAHQHLRELGPLDDGGRTIGERAARYLAAAGRRALERDDVSLAASLLGRALERLDTADPARAELALDWCEALLAAGDVGPAARAIDELGRFVAGSERLRAWHTCFVGQRAALTDPQALHATADAVAAAADALAAAGDAAGEAKAHFVHAIALARLGRVGACEAALDRALAAARRGHDRRRANAVLAGAPLAALWGPSPVTRASGRCLDVVRVLRITQGAPAVEAVALRCQAVLEALRGRTEAARRMIASSRHLVEELGITQRLLEADMFAGLIELLEGDAVTAERSLRAAYDGLRAHELGIDAAQAAALLGRALLAQDRAAEAEALSLESESLAGDDLQAAMAWRCVRAEALARRGEHAAAVAFARAAVELAAATDALLYHADARLALAAALRAAGRSDQAAAEEARAIELWDAKGATLLAERARGAERRTVQLELDRAPDARAESARPSGRRVRANAATAYATREDAAFVARNAAAFATLFADERKVVDHANGVTFDQREYLTSLGPLLRAPDLTRRHEPLATLGDDLALCRLSLSSGGITGRNFDVGAYDNEAIILIEVDAQGRCRRTEIFAENRLGDAIARLYERYAELLPDGPARARAAATARSVAVWSGPFDLDRLAASLAPSLETIDHRILGTWSARGAETSLQHWRALLDVVASVNVTDHDVLALEPAAFLVRRTWFGTDRGGGGIYEHVLLALFAFGADGLLTRFEGFDLDDEAEALARFDALTTEPAAGSAVMSARAANERARRVRPNAATVHAARLDGAMAAGEADALPGLFAEGVETVQHPSGATWDRRASLGGLRALLRAENPRLEHRPLATLGASLALCRQSMSFDALGEADVAPFGPVEADSLVMIEVDARGRRQRAEFFAADRLGNAVARLYERYAEILPEGPAQTRAAATAHAVAALMAASPEPIIATDCEYVDHRLLGFPALHGSEAIRRWIRSLFETADNLDFHTEEVLALESDALVVRSTNVGTHRAGGGSFERRFIALHVFGVDGRMRRWEHFEADHDAEALARFDALTAAPTPARPLTRRVRPNAATANAARVDAMIASRDANALPTLYAESAEFAEHATGVVFDRKGALLGMRSLLRARDPAYRHEPLATLGDALALCRVSRSAAAFAGGTFDVGAYETVEVHFIEVDAQGRSRRVETFAPDRLGDAVARLYERYADLLPDGPGRARAAATARSVAALLGPAGIREERLREPGRSLFAVDVEATDHRTVGFGSLRGADAVLRAIQALRQLSDDVDERMHDVLDLRSDALLVRWTTSGTIRATGGAFAQDLCMLFVFGTDGLMTCWEQFDADHDAEALARFDALVAETAPARSAPSRAAKKRARRVRANAATAHAARLEVALASRDADVLPALFAEELQGVDHPTGATVGREGHLSSWRLWLAADDPTCRFEPLATLGDALALCHVAMSARRLADGGFETGAVEKDEIALIEVDTRGRRRHGEYFKPDHLSDAIARLYERYADLLPDGPSRARAKATARSVAAFPVGTRIGPADIDRYAATLAPTIEFVDRRTFGVGSTNGAEAYIGWVHALFELADDVGIRIEEILGLRSDALLVRLLNSGTQRAGGGAYERQFLILRVFGPDGLVARLEQFDDDRDAEALARFDELAAEPATSRLAPAPVRAAQTRARRVRPNAATANAARFDTVVADRNVDALPTLFTEIAEFVEHPTGVVYDRKGVLFSLRALLRARDPLYRHQPLATLGDVLALCRVSASASGLTTGKFDVGAHEIEAIDVCEVDAQGRRRRVERFATDRLGDAVVRLYQRYTELLCDGPERIHAAATARAIAAMVGPLDLGRWATAFPPAIESVDRRTLGTWSARGAEEVLNHFRALLDLADGVSARIDDILGQRSDALLVRWAHAGTNRASGGAYERQFLLLWVFGTDGLVTRAELFDDDRDADALARFDELMTAAPAVRIANAATRAADRVHDAWEAGDWQRFAALLPAGTRNIDRRKMVQLESDRDQYLAALRPLFAMTSRVTEEALATRGNRLAMNRVVWEGTDGTIGPSEVELIAIIEVDESGDYRTVVLFDPDDLDAAYAELDRRFVTGEGAPHAEWLAHLQAYVQAFDARDDVTIRRLLPEDLTLTSHRRLVRYGPVSRDEWLSALRNLGELGELLVRVRVDHIPRLSATAGVIVVTNHGTVGGGAFEAPLVSVFAVDGNRPRSIDEFDLEQLDAAYARYDELTAAPPATPRITNAATRMFGRAFDALQAQDWERFAALFAPGFRGVDRRKMLQNELDRDEWLASYRPIVEMTSLLSTNEVLATRGDRLVLACYGWKGTDGLVGLSEIEYLLVIEVDGRGDHVAVVMFDPDDLDGAYTELDRRYAVGEAAPYARTWETVQRFARAAAARDWEELPSVFDPDLVLEDHRPIGFAPLHSRDEFVTSVRTLVDLAPDVTLRPDHVLALDDRGTLIVWRWTGSRDGGSFEIPVVAVWVLGPDGRIQRIDTYNPEQLDAARARFAAIRTGAARDPLAALARPNAASAAGDRWHAAFAVRDWAASRALCAPDARFEDRRRLARVSGDVDWWIADAQRRASMRNTRLERQLVGTAGDRVALERFLLTGDPGGAAAAPATESRRISSLGPFEIEFLWLAEVDESGRITAGVVFDVDDWRAATREACARWFARDAVAAASVGPAFELIEAFNDRDPTRMRAVLADGFVLDDHRPARLGLIEDADTWVEACAAMWDLAPDGQIAVACTLAHARYGSAILVRLFGTLRDGGAFESPSVAVFTVTDGRITRQELFEPEHVAPALTRFAELRPDPLRIPPNATTRVGDLWEAAIVAEDWVADEALFAPTLVFDDRRRGLLNTGDREMLLASDRLIASSRPRISRTVLATAGDRLALHHISVAGTSAVAGFEDVAFEVDALQVLEVDGDGRCVAAIWFDPDDRRTASAELFERYARSDAARWLPASVIEFWRAMHDHDLERIRAALPDDFVFHDHRRLNGLGRIEGADGYVASVAALFELAPDVTCETLYHVAAQQHGGLAVTHQYGTLAEGGKFESALVRLTLYDGQRFVGIELFELDDLDLARARLAELCP